jgi:uncharacterized protein YdhG (YjbR/CyaY superfamily)
MAAPGSVDEYFAGLTAEQQAAMEQLRGAIRQVVPEATEGISYQIPTFKVNGRPLVWYAAFKDHYSLYPATEVLRTRLGDELKPYLSGKGTLRFDADRPIPRELIERIVKIRLEEEAAR